HKIFVMGVIKTISLMGMWRYPYDGDSIKSLCETDGNGNVLRHYVYSIDGVRLAMKSQGTDVILSL
ncbi:hypothetical protein OCB11_25910, partial [Bacillus cereus]|nr:hypothetical protein [Bacillus cereus]